MRYQRIVQAVFFSPWLIKPEAHASIRKLVMGRVLNAEMPEREDGVDWCGEKVEVDQPYTEDGIAYIPIGGVLARKLNAFERGSGAVDTLDVAREIKVADADANVRGIILDIDSPGGIVNGTPELADAIGRVDKPIFAYTAGMMDSAAYWIASSCDQIFSTRSADVGSIGVYVPIFDQSKWYEEMGVSVDVIRSGPYKGAGYPGTSLTEEQRVKIQEEVDAIAMEFKDQVRKYRDVDDGTMQGQSFLGSQAKAFGLVDGLVESIEEVSAML